MRKLEPIIADDVVWGRAYYEMHEVDGVIAELKGDMNDLIDDRVSSMKLINEKISTIDQLEDDVAFWKKKLDDEMASRRDEYEKSEKEIRRLKRALWLARAEKARFLAMIIDQHPYTQVLHFTSRKRDDSGKPLGIARTAMEWWKMFEEVERKCRAKAEEYNV